MAVRITRSAPYDADVIIAGAGPAGAAAAFHLARAGVSALLLDRAEFPRDKVCGDFVGPLALVELRHLGVTQLAEYRTTNVARRAALYLHGRELISRPFPEIDGLPAYGRVIPRTVLDKWILDAARGAGVRVVEKCQLVSFASNPDAVTVHVRGPGGPLRLMSKLLIGADGGSSTVARIMRGAPPPRNDRIVAVRAYFENVAGPDDQLDLYFTSESFPGYYWLFPTGQRGANVGLGLALETVPVHDDTPGAILTRAIERDSALTRRLAGACLRGKITGWPLMTYNPRLPMVADRVVLVGDAAGLINPLNGEGIQYALLSGRWAAEVAAGCAMRDDFSRSALGAYGARVEHELRYDMALARLIIQLIANRALNPVWLEALRIIAGRARLDPEYARLTGGILAGLVPAREAISLRIIGGTLEQAATSLGIDAAYAALSGPSGWAGPGIGAAGIGFQLAYDAARNPEAFAAWVTRVADDAMQLAWQASWEVFAFASSPPAKVRIVR